MRNPMRILTRYSMCLPMLIALILPAHWVTAAAGPAFWKWAPTPPMGWNSYDAWGTSVNQQEVLANARYMAKYLRVHGWKYVIIDARWYDRTSSLNDRELNRQRAGAKLYADAFGRLLPAPNRFPSASGGRGFKALAAQVHAMGLKFGFHMMRGIPRQDYKSNTPIAGSHYTARQAADTKSVCGWCPDMYGVRNNTAGQAWYNSCARLWASWGVDFVKVDDLSSPYHKDEITMIRKAIYACGHPIVLSTSAGPTPMWAAQHVSTHANMWRISGDFWDRWNDLNRQFDLLARWQKYIGPGHWADADMIPFGHIGIKNTIAGGNRETRFTENEQHTLFSLWSLGSSPLMLGDNLPDTDARTLSILTNDEVIAVDQDPLGRPARRIKEGGGKEVWVKAVENGTAVGLFNRGSKTAKVTLYWRDAGLAGKETLRNLWTHKNIGTFEQRYSTMVPAHGVVLLLAKRP